MLRIRIDLNDLPLSEIRAVRVDGDAHPDSIGVYEVSLMEGKKERDFGTVWHRYGDGAIRLTEIVSRHVANNLALKIGRNGIDGNGE